jgi:hypothetical protein
MIQAIRKRRKNRKRNQYLTAPLRWLSAEPMRRAYPLAKMAADWAVERLISVDGTPIPVPKALVLDLKSVRRPWSSALAIRVRLKW